MAEFAAFLPIHTLSAEYCADDDNAATGAVNASPSPSPSYAAAARANRAAPGTV